MFRRIFSILLVTVFLFATIGMSLAAGDKGNARKGKYTYRKACRTCHAEGGSAKDLSPIDKTQAQWDEIFKNLDKLKCKDEWKKVSAADQDDIYAHLWGHAFDSPSPEKCQ